MTERRYEGQIAVVTGGARGIGAGIGARLAQEGARVVVWDRDPSLFDAGAAGFRPDGLLATDVADAASVAAAAAATLSAHGRVDVLVNNAGINGPVVETQDYPLEAWNRVLAVNLTGVFLCCRALVPPMRAQAYGRIVNIASIGGKEGVPGISAYTAAKAGVIGFTKTLARELATSGVLVNAVAPSMVETDLLREMTQEHIAASRAKIPMGRLLTIPEVAAVVAFAGSRDNGFTTGFTFDATGGRADY